MKRSDGSAVGHVASWSHAVCVLAPWLDSGEIAHRSRTINGVPRPRRIDIPCEYTGSYVHVRENGPQQHSATSLTCTEVMETTQNKD